MKKYLQLLFITSAFFACNNKGNEPDVSHIKIDIKVQRFEKDLFALDTNNMVPQLQMLNNKYPGFFTDFTQQILGFAPSTPADSVGKYIRYFLRDYRFVKDSSDKLFNFFNEQLSQIEKALKYVKYYFPQYKIPAKVITFIGPFDGYSDIITADAYAVGLQLHMGKNYSFYNSPVGHNLFPNYIIEKFTPETIPVNLVMNTIDDMFPEKKMLMPLLEQMVEKGKRLYVCDRILPDVSDHIKIGYTEEQTKDAYKNEAVIWDFFLTNELLNVTDQNVTKNYIGESPKTQELGEGAPGNIGSFSGWQIVKIFMKKNSEVSLSQLMNMEPRDIYNRSKYKPKS
ncbi:gliding motility lipoprotein GldB [soil metagenome]